LPRRDRIVPPLTATGIMLSGALVGVLIGSGAKSWELRYP
jgi:hypothetical protein